MKIILAMAVTAFTVFHQPAEAASKFQVGNGTIRLRATPTSFEVVLGKGVTHTAAFRGTTYETGERVFLGAEHVRLDGSQVTHSFTFNTTRDNGLPRRHDLKVIWEQGSSSPPQIHLSREPMNPKHSDERVKVRGLNDAIHRINQTLRAKRQKTRVPKQTGP